MYFVHSDHLGTPQQLTDEAAQIVWAADYEPFGKVSLQRSTVRNSIRFPGQYFDAETELHYNYLRSYDTSIGRYLQADPIGLRGGANTFQYGNADPISEIDPMGLISWKGTLSQLAGGVGIVAGAFVFELETKCINGKKGRALVALGGPGVGAGVRLGFSSGNITLNDSLSYIDPYVFDDTSADGGFIAFAGIGVPANLGVHTGKVIVKPDTSPTGAGYGCAIVRLGQAGGFGCAYLFALDLSVGLIGGTSTVLQASVEDCVDCSQ